MRQQRGSVFAVLLVLVLTAGSPVIAQQSGYYVLDGFGGVHAGGGAPAMSPQTPYFGFDIAKDIAYVPPNPGTASGIDGIIVLDGFGGVHAGGPLKASSSTPLAPTTAYFGFNVARAIALRDHVPPRAARFTTSAGLVVSSTASYVSTGSVTVVAPRNGILLFTATFEVFCQSFGSVGDAAVRMAVGLNSTTPTLGVDYPLGIEECNVGAGPVAFQHTVTISAPLSVAAGSHTVHLLARDEGGIQNPVVSDRLLSVIFVD